MTPCVSANIEGPQVWSAYTGSEKFKKLGGRVYNENNWPVNS